MADLRKIVAGLVKFDVTQFIGEEGNIFFNVETGELRLSDGVTPGGLPISVVDFLRLLDTPNSYSNQAGKIVAVKSAEDGLEFIDPPAGSGNGIFIKDVLNDETELPVVGQEGDAYLINDVIYIWSPTQQIWIDVGSITGGGSGSGVNGSAFITDIEPQDPLQSVGEKVFSSDGEVLDSCSTTTNLITVSVLALPGNTNWKPVLTIKGQTVNLVAQNDSPLFRGSIDIDLAGDSELKVVHEDGAEHTVQITVDSPPVIQQATLTGTYPGSQTELKENDVFTMDVVVDIPVVQIEISDYGAAKYSLINVSEGTSHSITITIANRGNTLQQFGIKLRVKKSTGAWSEYYLTEDDGIVNGENILFLNNVRPAVSFSGVTYPAGQSAIKETETATVNHSISNFDTVSYSTSNNELTITDPQTFQSSKSVSRNSGSYNISTNNFIVTAVRAANGSSVTSGITVKIAHTPPTINVTITGNPARLRSGGNDGTAVQTYSINIVSNQRLSAAPSMIAPEGTFSGSGFTGGPTTWSRSLSISDNDARGSFNFGNLSAINEANVEQTVISGGSTYTIGGFVTRQVFLEAFQNEIDINVPVDNYNKVTLSWSFNAGVTNRAAVDSVAPVFQSWCLLSPIGQSPVTIRILDDSYNASTQQSIITIQETV